MVTSLKVTSLNAAQQFDKFIITFLPRMYVQLMRGSV